MGSNGSSDSGGPKGSPKLGAGYQYVILDMPLLFETNTLTRFMRYTVFVYWMGHLAWLHQGEAKPMRLDQAYATAAAAGKHRLLRSRGRQGEWLGTPALFTRHQGEEACGKRCLLPFIYLLEPRAPGPAELVFLSQSVTHKPTNKRLMSRDGLTPTEAQACLAAQLPLSQKVELADHVIDSSGDTEAMRRQVLKLHAAPEDSLDFVLVRLLAAAAMAGISGLLYFLLWKLMS
ncbi:Dephospho-CoA kinase domain-containing protein [Varanus komodoensis]|nr:Dephospho-CoA kinase domain-containing protein [Varanus komodoensis]